MPAKKGGKLKGAAVTSKSIVTRSKTTLAKRVAVRQPKRKAAPTIILLDTDDETDQSPSAACYLDPPNENSDFEEPAPNTRQVAVTVPIEKKRRLSATTSALRSGSHWLSSLSATPPAAAQSTQGALWTDEFAPRRAVRHCELLS